MKHLVVFGLGESDLADDARAVAGGAGHRREGGSAALRNRFIRSDQYSFIRAGIPSIATKIGVTPGFTRSGARQQKWQAERYHGVADDLNQPVDLVAVGAYQELCKRLALRVANRQRRPSWYDTSVFAQLLDHFRKRDLHAGELACSILPATRRSRQPAPGADREVRREHLQEVVHEPRSSTPRRKPAQVVCTGNRCEASRTFRSASSSPSMARFGEDTDAQALRGRIS